MTQMELTPQEYEDVRVAARKGAAKWGRSVAEVESDLYLYLLANPARVKRWREQEDGLKMRRHALKCHVSDSSRVVTQHEETEMYLSLNGMVPPPCVYSDDEILAALALVSEGQPATDAATADVSAAFYTLTARQRELIRLRYLNHETPTTKSQRDAARSAWRRLRKHLSGEGASWERSAFRFD